MSTTRSDQSNPPRSGDPDTSEQLKRLAEVVRQATALRAEDRMSFLRRICSGDDLLLAQALEGLRRNAPQWWDQSIEARIFEPSDYSYERAGELIGPYRIVRTLGHGGMGEVVLAERDDQQFRQQVAIKLVKRGGLSRSLQGRLKIERQILATLNHPNIARLLDGGTSSDGTPYIVMEYIDGESVDTYCDRNRLGVAARLKLFRTICSAVHAAHQNLIVHRDLKPSNILVTKDGTLKLLDFGIAKLLDDHDLINTMAVTQMDVRVMTPEHASPEQIRGEPLTTASDTFALGVLLYTLLTGQKPYIIRSTRLSEIEKAICDQPPAPMDSWLQVRFDNTDESIEKICAARATTSARLRREFRGDLHLIVMTAMRKEPERRYASVEQLSADINRYLVGMPINARDDSWQYRADRFLRRHAIGVSVAALIFLGVIAFAVTTTLQARRIAREQARAAGIASFLVNMFEQADPSHSRGKEVTVREMLDVGTRKLSDELTHQPDTRASLLSTIGKVYSDLGLYDDAEKPLRESLQMRTALYGLDNAETADAMTLLSESIIQKRENLAEAEPLLNKALETNRRIFGNRSFEVAKCLHRLANLRFGQQRLPDAESLYNEALNILVPPQSMYKGTSKQKISPENSREISETLGDFAILKDRKAEYKESEKLYRTSIEITAQTLGRDHPVTIVNIHNLAIALQRQGKPAEAEPLFRESLELFKKVFGPEHPETLAALANFGAFLQLRHDLDGAEQTFREVLELRRKVRGEGHSSVGYDHVNLGLLLSEKENFVDAEREYRAALANYAISIAPNHPYIGSARRSLAVALLAQNRSKEAEAELQAALKVFKSTLPDGNPQVAATRVALGKVLLEQKRFAEAAPLLTDNYRLLAKALNPDHPMLVRARGWVNDYFRTRDKPEEARLFFASVRDAKEKSN